MILPYKHKIYYGFNDGNAPSVFVSNAGRTMAPLPLRLDIVNHSRTGFGWGYSGSAPTPLPVAILADWMSCDHAALALHQTFKAAGIAGLEKHWSLSDDDLVRIFRRCAKSGRGYKGWQPWKVGQLFKLWTGMLTIMGNL